MDRTKLYAVAGKPVLHSKSPDMFRAAFQALSIDAVYTRLALSSAQEVIDQARAVGFSGLNITSPFKETIIPHLDAVDPVAMEIGAVNTVTVTGGELTGHNTDYIGIIKTLEEKSISLGDAKVIVVGAGGAARAAVFGLLSAGAEVVVANRTFEKAASLADRFHCRAATFEKISREIVDARLLVSALPDSAEVMETFPLRKGLVVFDANYRTDVPRTPDEFTVNFPCNGDTALTRRAARVGCTVINGKEWLLHQGAEAFRHFTGTEAPLSVMRKALFKEKPVGKKNIALVGFMGTGKTSIGENLSRRTGMAFIDTDKLIEIKNGKSVAQIFQESGEKAFRRIETKALEKTRYSKQSVISCGGGAVLNRKNRETLSHSLLVWLWADIGTVYQRTSVDGSRPLLSGDAATVLGSRIPFYAGTADILLSTEGKSVQEITERIIYETGLPISH